LPIIETKGGDIAGYIPTNVISITDGQIFLSTRLFNEGFRPAVDLGLSVSRVGSKAQYGCMKHVCKKVKADYSMYRAYAALAKVSSDIEAGLLRFIARGTRLNHLFIQGLYETVRLGRQVIALHAFGKGYLDNVDPE
jgi:F-type H+-transporting ATPase subunit alpha